MNQHNNQEILLIFYLENIKSHSEKNYFENEVYKIIEDKTYFYFIFVKNKLDTTVYI